MPRAQRLQRTPLRRTLDLILGSLALILGVLLIFTPGPASAVIPFALALLGREFRWARQGSLVLRRKLRSLLRRRPRTPIRQFERASGPATRAA